ncbi:MAG: response regulator transcription factor [Kordiimonadaceae bacterium]|nr:response regulator transcription factor [Kordiimonadaceae bacterium]MBO6568730.1 response regulator transcription factor [Kordiimonadaceae bacterium]MBO6965294.1 response regulator transcription factor [Kordiimonadaceae bacterium]
MRILVIEDDKEVVGYIEKGLRELGFTVDTASDGKDGLFLATTETYDAIITDRMLPGVEGLTILNALRASDIQTPVLVLSALSSVEERVKGLKAGADDYLIKPFAFEELVARLEVMIARSKPAGAEQTKLQCFDLEMDLLARTVTRSGQSVELQTREFKLLEYLLRHQGQVVTRTMLLENVWDYNFDPQTNIIDVHISRLRQKISPNSDTQLIETVRGAGYRMQAPT